jgi:hypothetical protein
MHTSDLVFFQGADGMRGGAQGRFAGTYKRLRLVAQDRLHAATRGDATRMPIGGMRSLDRAFPDFRGTQAPRSASHPSALSKI